MQIGRNNRRQANLYDPDGTRVEQLAEAVQIVRAMWTQEQASFAGRHYRVSAARCEPKPNPVPPILIGAFAGLMPAVRASRMPPTEALRTV